MKVRCPECGSLGTLSSDLAGQMTRCSQCKAKFTAVEDREAGAGIKWYYALEDEKKGPISEVEFARLVGAGDIAPSTLVWCKGMSDWQTLDVVQAGQSLAAVPVELPRKMKVRCPDCGRKGTLNVEMAGKLVRCPECGGKSLAKEDAGLEAGVKWYYAQGGEKKGPINAVVFDQLIAAGEIVSNTLVWCKGMTSWQPLVGVIGEHTVAIADQTPREDSGRPAETHHEADLSQTLGGRTAGWSSLAYAGPGVRMVAKLIDTVFAFALASMVDGLGRKLFPDSFVVGGTINNVYLVTVSICCLLGMLYMTWFVGKFGATPGKMVMNLKVVTATGRKVGYAQAFGRYCAESMLVVLSLFLGYLPIFFDPQRRGLHDRLCGTRVVKV